MSEWVVRVAGDGDRVGVRGLMVGLHGEGAAGVSLPVVRQVGRVFVVGEGDELDGMVVGTFVDYGFEPYGVVEELVVREGSRRAGVGAALLAECREWMAQLGAEVVFVSAIDEEVVGFYAGQGFSRCVGPWLWA